MRDLAAFITALLVLVIIFVLTAHFLGVDIAVLAMRVASVGG